MPFCSPHLLPNQNFNLFLFFSFLFLLRSSSLQDLVAQRLLPISFTLVLLKYHLTSLSLSLPLSRSLNNRKKKCKTARIFYFQICYPHYCKDTAIFFFTKRVYLYYYLRGFSCLDSSFFSSEIPLHLYIYVETKLKDNLVKM